MNNFETSESVKGLILGDHWELCYSAHRNTSFVPERRAKQIIESYSEQLESDLKELGDNSGNYKQKYIDRFTTWMNAKSRCASSMITGPANFPVNKMRKANSAEHNRYNDFQIWREKYFKAVNRVPTKSPEEELILAENKLETLRNLQLEMKAINVAIRKSKINDQQKLIDHLMLLDFDTSTIGKIDEWNGVFKIPSYRLTNNNAKIKSAEQKIVIMTNRISRKNTWEDIKFEGGYVTLDDDRIKIFHDDKPSREVLSTIKSNGFRWSPHWGCWCRKHTGNAVAVAKQLVESKSL